MYRNFGVELELYGLSVNQATEVLCEAGIDARAEQYNHETRTWWKVLTDVSIQDSRGHTHHQGALTCEVVSPILAGEAGLESLAKVCKILTAAGGKVNKSCGLHVHIDARRLDVKSIASLVVRYAQHESVIDSFMPISRRANNNTQYLGSICDVVNRHHDIIGGLSSVQLISSRLFRGCRFYKLNLESYARHGTVEFRHHSGSLNAEKVCNWVRFCQNFVEVSKNVANATIVNVVAPNNNIASNAIEYLAPRRGRPVNPDAIRLVNACIRLSTNGDCREVYVSSVFSEMNQNGSNINWRARKIPAALINALRNRGYQISTTWRGRYITIQNPNHVGFTQSECSLIPLVRSGYNSNVAQNNQVILNPLDSCFDGLSDDVVSYYNERISDLAA